MLRAGAEGGTIQSPLYGFASGTPDEYLFEQDYLLDELGTKEAAAASMALPAAAGDSCGPRPTGYSAAAAYDLRPYLFHTEHTLDQDDDCRGQKVGGVSGANEFYLLVSLVIFVFFLDNFLAYYCQPIT